MKATSACQFHTIELTYIFTSNSSGTLIHFYFLQVIATLKGHTKKVTNVVYHPHEVFSLSSVTSLSRGGSLFGWNIFSGWLCYIILFDLKPLNHFQMLHDHTFNYLTLIMFFFPLDNFLLLTTCMTVHVNMVLKEQNFELFWQGVHINVLNHKIYDSFLLLFPTGSWILSVSRCYHSCMVYSSSDLLSCC